MADCVPRGLDQRSSLGDVAAGDAGVHHAGKSQPRLDAVEQLDQRAVALLSALDLEAGVFEQSRDLGERSGVSDAGNPCLQARQRGGKLGALGGHVRERQPGAGPEHACQLGGRALLVGEGAEGAFAECAVDGAVVERQRLGVAAEEAHPRLAGGIWRRREIDPDHLAARSAGELQRAGARPGRDVDDGRAGADADAEGGDELGGQSLPAGMERVAEQEARRRRRVGGRTAGFDVVGCNAHGAAVFEPKRVGCSSGCNGTAFGTTGATAAPLICARTCSR